jgi:hypothetical protein
MAECYAAICYGERPWTALGNFLNEWFDYTKDDRQLLVIQSIAIPPLPTNEEIRWAAFCAASVEWLCICSQVPCPRWVEDVAARLPEPWFHAFHPENQAVQERLIDQTPEPFARRNIFCGNRIFANKYDLAGQR